LSTKNSGDVAFFLYLTPFIANFVYTLYLWASSGISLVLPQLVFLEVTQNPYVFLVGIAAVIFAGLLDVTGEEPGSRRPAVLKLSSRLQMIATVSIVLAAVSSLYAAHLDVGTALFNLLDGRYPLIFPALLVLFSFLILPTIKLPTSDYVGVVIVLLLLASPLVLHEVGKSNVAAALALSLLMLLAAAVLFLRRGKL
jgi:hypothetical protein